ncbi:MAG: hypothetical protein CSA72_10585 [Rhodobacterales bacterium]|nr:MAG: hypothetical protein CSA72_10585 [Rhodobacterales bacterium]
MTDAIIGWGGTVRRSVDAGQNWVELIEVKTPIVPEVEFEFKEATHIKSPGRAREYVRGLSDVSEIEIPQNYTKAGFQQQYNDQESGDLIMYEIELSDGVKFAFSGYPTVRVSDVPVDDVVQMVTKIRISGPVTPTIPA